MKLTKTILNYPIELSTETMGKDIAVHIKGGITPHIGAVSLIAPDFPMQTLALPHHKDHLITEMYAAALYQHLGCAITVTCGIHYDDATKEELEIIMTQTKSMLSELICQLKEESQTC